MTSKFDLAEYLTAYLGEAEDQLRIANAKILEIEAWAQEGKAHPRAVRDLFRALHTTKGLSAMVGVEPVVAISHRMESILRQADRHEGRLPPNAINVLLEGIRAIERATRDLAAKKEPAAPSPALLAALDSLEKTDSIAVAKIEAKPIELDPALGDKLAAFELEQLTTAPSRGQRALRVDFSPSPAKAERGLSINSVRERLSGIADIVKVVPRSVPATADAPGALSFAILLVSASSDHDIADAVGVEAAAVQTLAGASAPLEPAEEARVVDAELVDDDEAFPRRRNVVRVDVGRLDDAMEHLSSLIVTRSRLARAIAKLGAEGVVTRDLNEIMRDNARQLRELRAAILRVRMVPVSELLDRVPLLVRAASRERKKIVRLALDTGDAELDKGVGERLFPAVVHLVRNAVDHAIESPDERTKAGKGEAGHLKITCSTVSNTQLEVTITDDGRGVDRAALEAKIGSALDSDLAVLDALCRPGVSTTTELTTTSGRGMGMDIVKRIVVDQLGGQLSMSTTPGQGTTFVLRVPLTISIVDAFAMECRAQRFVVPVSMVEEILEIDASKVRFGPNPRGGRSQTGILERRGETVPLVELASALRIDPSASGARQALLVRHRGNPIAFGIDRVLGQQEAVVRPLIDPLVQAPGIAGATDLGDGKPTVVLDLVALGASLARGDRAA